MCCELINSIYKICERFWEIWQKLLATLLNEEICSVIVCNTTLSLKSLSGLSYVCYKITLITGGVGGADPPTSKLGTHLLWSFALSIPIYSNFQINGTSGETLKHFSQKKNPKINNTIV